MDTAERTLLARARAFRSWAATSDPSARTAPARAAFRSRFDRQVDPLGVLPTEERSRRADYARRAFYTELAISSARARAARKAKQAARDEPTAARPAIGSTDGLHATAFPD